MANKLKGKESRDASFIKAFAAVVNESSIVKTKVTHEEKPKPVVRRLEPDAQRKRPGPAAKEPEASPQKVDSSPEGLAKAALRAVNIRSDNKQNLRIAMELIKEGAAVNEKNVELKKAVLVINPETSKLAIENVRWLVKASSPWEYFTTEMNSPNLPGSSERLELLIDCVPERTALFLVKFAAASLYSEGLERFLGKSEGKDFVYKLIGRLGREGKSLDAKKRLSEAQKRAFINAGAEFITGKGEASVIEFVAELRKLGEKLKA